MWLNSRIDKLKVGLFDFIIKYKAYFLILTDSSLIVISYLSALYFTFSTDISYERIRNIFKVLPIIVLIYISFFCIFKIYARLWSLANVGGFLHSISVACVMATGINYAIQMHIKNRIPLLVVLLAGMFINITTFGYRLFFKICKRVLNKSYGRNYKGSRVLIIGAGSAAEALIKEIKHSKEANYNIVALIDDDKNKIGRYLCGVKIIGSSKDIAKVVEEQKIEVIILAINNISNEARKNIVCVCSNTSARTKILPNIMESINKKVSLKQIRDVNLADLLGRGTVVLNEERINEYIKGKRVLVTGGGGSIGSELCRQIVKFNPSELMILDCYENNAYEIQQELISEYPGLKLKVLIATIRDKTRLENIFKAHRPQVVYHAAAHKHVPLMEQNECEAIKNNVFGTLNLVECADKYNVSKFVLISSDKAVNPTNVMGASKRICEMIIQAMKGNSRTEFVAVRFGNVLGSNGSVIPLFKKQIDKGGPITITNKYITRYFMLIPEATQLVLQAGALAKGGEIFVLDMGAPVKIYDLAYNLINLAGLVPHKDIKFEFIGLRPGEKLYEELLMTEEGLTDTNHSKIFIEKPKFFDINELKQKVEELKFYFNNNELLRRKISEIVPTYNDITTKSPVAITETSEV